MFDNLVRVIFIDYCVCVCVCVWHAAVFLLSVLLVHNQTSRVYLRSHRIRVPLRISRRRLALCPSCAEVGESFPRLLSCPSNIRAVFELLLRRINACTRQQVTSKVELYIVLPCPQDMFRKQCVASVEV